MGAVRPSEFSQELADAICAELASGRSVRSICVDEAMPAASTVFLWLSKHPEFSEQYARAREAQADALLEEIFEIADDGKGDSYTDAEGNLRTDHDVIARSRLRVDTRKWAMSKLKPKKYGDKLDLNHSGSIATMSEEQVNARLAELLRKAGVGIADGAQGQADHGE